MTSHLAHVPPNKIPVIASSDDNYAVPVNVMFVSLLENTQSPENFHLFIIDGGISQSKKDSIESDVKRYNSQITFLDINSETYANFPTKAHISVPAYYRISIPELFDNSVEKVIYLDCDLIIKHDLQELWQIGLENYAIAAVENIAGTTYKASGLKQSDYFNSGVMLINLNKWRNENIPDKVRKFKIKHPELISTNDQCALNGVFKGNWKRLPLKWNHQSGLYRKSQQIDRLQKEGSVDEAIWNPAIIHYVGSFKPWFTPCYHPLEGEYRRYKALSSYASLDIIKRKANYFSISLLKKSLRQYKWQRNYKQKGFNLYAE